MSIFNTASIPCPVCKTPKKFNLVASVNADRRPDLRLAIMDGSFQREKCDSCSNTFRTAPLMTYLDMARHQWILVQPAADVARWQLLAEKAKSVFSVAYGPEAVPEAQEIGRDMKPRVVFGWSALSEKILAAELGLDDVNLELVKLAVLREVPDPPLNDVNELRLTGIEGDELVLTWINPEDETFAGSLKVPREVYDDIAADTGDWQPLREELSADPFVDFQKLMTDEAAAEAEGEEETTAAEEGEGGDEDEEEEEKGGKRSGGKKAKSKPKAKAKKAPAKKRSIPKKAVPKKKGKKK